MDNHLPPDPYKTLGVPKDATHAVIRSAHSKLALRYHPDRNPSAEKEAGEHFQLVQQAYEILRDDAQRSRYDDRVKLAELRAEREAAIPTVTSSEEYNYRKPALRLRGKYLIKNKVRTRAESPKRRPSRARRSQRDNYSDRSLSRSSFRPESPNRITFGPQRPVRDNDSIRNRKEAAFRLENQTLADLSRAARKALANQPPTANENTIEGLAGFLNGAPVCTLADTGADKNFIARAFAEELHCDLIYYPPDARPSFLMGHGGKVHAIADVKLSWQFKKEPENTYDVGFYVLPNCIFDVMMGGAFLYATSTMTLHRNRLSRIPRPRRALHTRVVNLCGTRSRRLNGILRGKKCRALPDSGAEPNLLSYRYVTQRGWLLNMVPGPESCTLLQFADGSTETTEGRLHLEWSFARGWDVTSPSAPYSITFDVLRGCPFDVILGQDFLDHTDAFTENIESFQDVYHEGLAGLNLVYWADSPFLKSKKKKATTRNRQQTQPPQATFQAAVLEELECRAEADRRIARISDNAERKSIETECERVRRSQWERAQRWQRDAVHPGTLQQYNSHNGTATMPTSSSISPEPSRTSGSPSSTASSSSASQTTSSSQANSHAESSNTSMGRDNPSRFSDSSTSPPRKRAPKPSDERWPAQPLRDAFLRRSSRKTPLRPPRPPTSSVFSRLLSRLGKKKNPPSAHRTL